MFHTGKNVIEFTPTDSGTILYNCWMGMIRGKIIVNDSENDVDAAVEEKGNDTEVFLENQGSCCEY